MSGAREAATKGLHLGLATVRHAGWWLRWHTDGNASREITELGRLTPRTANAQRPVA
jgi:hypothetical protein